MAKAAKKAAKAPVARKRTQSAKSRSAQVARPRTAKESLAAKATTDHEAIRRWAEERMGTPACVTETAGNDAAAVLRIDFPGGDGASLSGVAWDEWFEKFDKSNLAFLYQDTTGGGEPSKYKLVNREAAAGSKTRRAGG